MATSVLSGQMDILRRLMSAQALWQNHCWEAVDVFRHCQAGVWCCTPLLCHELLVVANACRGQQ